MPVEILTTLHLVTRCSTAKISSQSSFSKYTSSLDLIHKNKEVRSAIDIRQPMGLLQY